MKNKKFLKMFDTLFVFFTFLYVGLSYGMGNKLVSYFLGFAQIYSKKIEGRLGVLTILPLSLFFLVFSFLILCVIIPKSRFRLVCNFIYGLVWVSDLCFNIYSFYLYFTSDEARILSTLLNYSVLPTIISLIVIVLIGFKLVIDHKALKEEGTQSTSDTGVGLPGYILRALAIMVFIAVEYYGIVFLESLPPLQMAGLHLTLAFSDNMLENFGLWILINPIVRLILGGLFAALFIRNSPFKWICNAVYALIHVGAAIVLYPNLEKMGAGMGSIVKLVISFVLVAAIIAVDVYTLKNYKPKEIQGLASKEDIIESSDF